MISLCPSRIGNALSSTLLIICLLWLTACKENPEAPGPSEEQSSVMLTAPAPNDVFLPGTNVKIIWKLRPGMAAPDSVQLQFRALDPETPWQTIVWRKSGAGEYNMQLSDSLTGRFELRIRGNSDEVWDTTTPLLAGTVAVSVLSPLANQIVRTNTVLFLRWELKFPVFPPGYAIEDTGDVEIQYQSLGGAAEWKPIGRVQAESRVFVWNLPAGLNGAIQIRFRSTLSKLWAVVGPVQIVDMVVRLSYPVRGAVFRIGSTIPLRWEGPADMPPGDPVAIEVYASGSWKKVGTFTFGQKETTWYPASQVSAMYSFRIRQGNAGEWRVVDSIRTADLRILDFPEGSTLARGSAFTLSADVKVFWDFRRSFIQLMSTDDGRSWPITIAGPPVLVDYPAGGNYRFLIKRDDLPFADTSVRFSVTENLADVKVLEVGRHYIYKYTEMHWWVYAGGTRITPIDHPDVHILVHDVALQPNKSVYNVSYWNEGSKDTVRSRIDELHGGLHTIVADFMPFSISRICTRTDAASDSVQYRWENSTLTLIRGRGLTYAAIWGGSYPDAREHQFRLK